MNEDQIDYVLGLVTVVVVVLLLSYA